MEMIISTKNKNVKDAKSLCEKKFRDSTGLFLIEGINIFKDMTSDVEIKSIFVTENRVKELSDLLDNRQCEVYYVSNGVMDYLSDTVTPYGIVAVCKKNLKQFALPNANALLLDGVKDPGNLGTILRTCLATDFLDVYMLNTVDCFSPKVVRSTLGGLFKVNLYKIDINQAFELLENTFSIALDMGGDSLIENKIQSPVLFVLGSETKGVSDEIKDKVKYIKSLPMLNQIESLNVAVAGAVAMYQTL